MRQIELTQGKVALVDDGLFDYLNQWKWLAQKQRTGRFYAKRRQGNKYVNMHRVIAEIRGLSLDGDIDHKDGDGLNNQTRNLRAATRQQNLANYGPQRNNKSGFKGVSWYERNKTWRAHIRLGGKNNHLGYFDTAFEAALAYDDAAREAFGEFAYSNERQIA